MFERVRLLSQMPCPAGHEEDFNRWLAARWRPYLQSDEVTAVGNLIGHVGGSGSKVALVVHSDELAFMVRAIDDRGFLRLTSNQNAGAGHPSLRGPSFLPLGHPALVLGAGDPVEGIFATVTGHLLEPREDRESLSWEDVFVDIGASSRADVEAVGIAVGSQVTWNPPLRQRGKLLYGKAMDNRAALAILEAFLSAVDPNQLSCDLWVVSTAMEELGTIGAASITQHFEPRYAIVLDIAPAGDIPTVNADEVPTRLGAGPVFVGKGQRIPYSRKLIRLLEHTANGAGLSFQRAVYDHLGTDADELIRHGIESAVIGLPTRYTHSPFEMVHEDDLYACVRLLHQLVTSPDWSEDL